MKKIICLILACLLTVTLGACAGRYDKGFRAGYGREKVMPDTPLTLGGSGTADRVSEGVLDFLYVTCIAITDKNDQTVLLITQDFLNSDDSFVIPAKERIAEATGVPIENIMVSGTHTHSAPAITGNHPGMAEYRELYYKRIVKAAVTAMEDRSAATVQTGSVWAEGMAFSRQYILPDGTMTNKCRKLFESRKSPG